MGKGKGKGKGKGMGKGMDADAGWEQAAVTLKVMQRMRLSPAEVWVHYIGTGGGVDEFEFNAYLHGLMDLPVHERDTITHAVNELYDDAYRDGRAPYSSDLSQAKRSKP